MSCSLPEFMTQLYLFDWNVWQICDTIVSSHFWLITPTMSWFCHINVIVEMSWLCYQNVNSLYLFSGLLLFWNFKNTVRKKFQVQVEWARTQWKRTLKKRDETFVRERVPVRILRVPGQSGDQRGDIYCFLSISWLGRVILGCGPKQTSNGTFDSRMRLR